MCAESRYPASESIRHDGIGDLVCYIFASGYRRKLLIRDHQFEITPTRTQVRP